MKSKLIWCFLLIACAGASVRAQGAGQGREVAERAKRYEPHVAASAARHEIDARLLWVIAWLETRFNPRAISRKGARGMMQMMPATARRFGLQNPHDPIAAIDAAARYVRLLLMRYDGRADLVLAAYNAGEGAVDAYLTGRTIQAGSKVINPGRRITGGVPPYRETQHYVASGLRLLAGQSPPSLLVAHSNRAATARAARRKETIPPPPTSSRKSINYTNKPKAEMATSVSAIRRSISW